MAALLKRTLSRKPTAGTHWTVRLAAQASGISKTTVHRLFQASITSIFAFNATAECISRGLRFVHPVLLILQRFFWCVEQSPAGHAVSDEIPTAATSIDLDDLPFWKAINAVADCSHRSVTAKHLVGLVPPHCEPVAHSLILQGPARHIPHGPKASARQRNRLFRVEWHSLAHREKQ